jgi:hypothetical protein
MKLKLVSIGTDPEVFISKNGNVVPCIGIIGGSKMEPLIVNDDLSVLEDNVSLEWNISPSFSKAEFSEKNLWALEYIRNNVLPNGYSLEIKDIHIFDDKDLDNEQAQTFGCQPDFSAYTMKINTTPDPRVSARTSAGHIHIGLNMPLEIEEVINLVRVFDSIIGTYCVMNEKESHRRKLYGSAGSFRFKDYGFEYRVPSNFWIDKPEHMAKLYDLIESAIDIFDEYDGVVVNSDSFTIIQKSINDHIKSNCTKIHEKFLKLKNEEDIRVKSTT